MHRNSSRIIEAYIIRASLCCLCFTRVADDCLRANVWFVSRLFGPRFYDCGLRNECISLLACLSRSQYMYHICLCLATCTLSCPQLLLNYWHFFFIITHSSRNLMALIYLYFSLCLLVFPLVILCDLSHRVKQAVPRKIFR